MLAGTKRAHCAFVLLLWGDIPLQWKTDACTQELTSRLDPVIPQEVEKALVGDQKDPAPTAEAALNHFLDACQSKLNARVDWLPQQHSSGRWYGLVVVEWLQDGPAKPSTWQS